MTGLALLTIMDILLLLFLLIWNWATCLEGLPVWKRAGIVMLCIAVLPLTVLFVLGTGSWDWLDC